MGLPGSLKAKKAEQVRILYGVLPLGLPCSAHLPPLGSATFIWDSRLLWKNTCPDAVFELFPALGGICDLVLTVSLRSLSLLPLFYRN